MAENANASGQPASRKRAFYDAQGKDLEIVAALGLTRLYGVAADGAISANSLGMDYDKFIHPALEKVPQELTFSFDLGCGTMELGPGAGCVLGMPDTGKSLFANTLHGRNSSIAEVIRFREPEVDSLLNEASLVRALFLALEGPAQLIFVDSLRTTFYTEGGVTGKGGVNMGIFALLTAYDILARRAGKVVLFALNPMTNDKDAIEFYLEATRGSVAHTFHATGPKCLNLSTRSNRDRGWRTVKYQPLNGKAEARQTDSGAIPITESRSGSILDLYTINLN